MCGGSHSLIFRDCGRAVSCCSCNKRSVLESNQCAAILAYWLAHSCSCSRFMALLHLTHLAARTAIAPDYVQWVITASAIILLWKKEMLLGKHTTVPVRQLLPVCDKLERVNELTESRLFLCFMSMKPHFFRCFFYLQ